MLELLLLETPADFTNRLRDQKVTEKDTIELVCELTRPNVQVKWMKNGSELRPSDRVKFINEGNIYKCVITDACMTDVEQYMCILPDGKKSKAMVTVEGRLTYQIICMYTQ